MRCGLVWACPVCSAKIRAERAEEITRLVRAHSEKGMVLMLTLTLKHALGDDLARIRRGVAEAWRFVQAGSGWKNLKHRIGFVGSVRALEVTVGGSGWHPHLHVLLLVEQLSTDQQEHLRRDFSMRWQLAVVRSLGEQHRPLDRAGCDLRVAVKGDYLAKLGLEVAASDNKDGRRTNRSPWQVATDFEQSRSPQDAAIWRAYLKGIKRARMLTWSRGLRAAYGLGAERPDSEIVKEESEVVMVLMIPAVVWDVVKHERGADVSLVEAAEAGGGHAATLCLDELYNRAMRRRILMPRPPS